MTDIQIAICEIAKESGGVCTPGELAKEVRLCLTGCQKANDSLADYQKKVQEKKNGNVQKL